MKRFFASDAESDMLIAEATKTFGLKIGDIINMAIIAVFKIKAHIRRSGTSRNNQR